MITHNYDKMMFKEMSQSYLNCFQKGFEKGNMWGNIFPTSVVLKWVEIRVYKIGVAYTCRISWLVIDRR